MRRSWPKLALSLVVLGAFHVLACSGAEEKGAAPDAGSDDAGVRTMDADVPVPQIDAAAPDASTEVPWAEVSSVPGATAKSRGGTAKGDDVLIVYGGCGATTSATQGLADALAASGTWPTAPRHLYAIKWTSSGCGYDGLFKNSLLGPDVVKKAGSSGKVTIVAHSSGAYVAHEWLAQAIGAKAPAWDTAHVLRGRLVYFNLDGGGDANLTAVETSDEGVPIYFVGAKDGATGLVSRNHATMKALGAQGTFVEIDATGSGCLAANCLHDAVITTLPHNRKSFVDSQGTSKPLWCDYASFPTQLDASCANIDEQKDRASTRKVVSTYLSK